MTEHTGQPAALSDIPMLAEYDDGIFQADHRLRH